MQTHQRAKKHTKDFFSGKFSGSHTIMFFRQPCSFLFTADSIIEDWPFIRVLEKVEIVKQNLSFKEVPATLVRFKGFLA